MGTAPERLAMVRDLYRRLPVPHQGTPNRNEIVTLVRGFEDALLAGWIAQEEQNEGLRTQNQTLMPELEALRARSVAEEPSSSIPAGIDTDTGTGTGTEPTTPDTVVADLLAVYTQVEKRYNAPLNSSLISRLRSLAPTEATILYNTCLASQTASSMNLLGLCCRYGVGVPRDPTRAIEWYSKSAHLGNPMAMNNLAVCLEEVTPPDEATVIEWYRRSADLGYPMAMYHLGLCLENGYGTPPNVMVAVRWYAEATDLEHPYAMVELGYCYQYGHGIPRDETLAIELYRRASQMGSGLAMIYLSNCLRDGIGTQKDELTASRYLGQCSRLRDDYPSTREFLRESIERTLTDDLRFEIVGRWVREEDETLVLRDQNHDLHREIDALRTELEYRPGGPGFRHALRDFEAHVGIHQRREKLKDHGPDLG